MEPRMELQKQIYDELVINYRKLEKLVEEMVKKELAGNDIMVMQLPHRIKTWESIEGKLRKKSEKYPSVTALSDILGFRIICYFSEQVDMAAAVLEKLFAVDRSRSSDKRTMISSTAFGYLSLHYICTLKDDGDYPEELKGLRFEFQLRTVLQHAWAEIEHDLGYKSVFDIPKSVRREFSRVAGLLEVADELFDQIKSRLASYEDDTRERIRTDRAEELMLDRITLNEYVCSGKAMQELTAAVKEVTGGEIITEEADSYLQKLSFLGIGNLGDMKCLIDEEKDHVLELVRNDLKYSDLQELTTRSLLHYLCKSRLIWGDYSRKDLMSYFMNASADENKARSLTERILGMREKFGAGAGK